ncbi:hypothetical protein IAT38_004330 [Cryptococcus sp. DSM 104549]
MPDTSLSCQISRLSSQVSSKLKGTKTAKSVPATLRDTALKCTIDLLAIDQARREFALDEPPNVVGRSEKMVREELTTCLDKLYGPAIDKVSAEVFRTMDNVVSRTTASTGLSLPFSRDFFTDSIRSTYCDHHVNDAYKKMIDDERYINDRPREYLVHYQDAVPLPPLFPNDESTKAALSRRIKGGSKPTCTDAEWYDFINERRDVMNERLLNGTVSVDWVAGNPELAISMATGTNNNDELNTPRKTTTYFDLDMFSDRNGLVEVDQEGTFHVWRPYGLPM